jgi:hypothetical protein
MNSGFAWVWAAEAHGIYFRDPIDLLKQGLPIDHLTTAKLPKLAGFAEMYRQHEFCFELLRWLSPRDPKIPDMTRQCLETYRRGGALFRLFLIEDGAHRFAPMRR